MLDAKLTSVRSRIPMNSAVRKDQSLLMENYRRFASKYSGLGPTKLDPLVKKKLQHEVDDRSPGGQMLSINNMS